VDVAADGIVGSNKIVRDGRVDVGAVCGDEQRVHLLHPCGAI